MRASPGHATLPREQPSGRGKVIDNSRSVIDGSWSILIRSISVIIIRYWRIVIKGGSTTARSWGVLVRSYTCYFARGRTFCYSWGRTGCTASQDRQYNTQSKSRGYLRQHARQNSIGGNPPDHVCGVHLHRERSVSDLAGGKTGDKNPQRHTKMPSTSRISIAWIHCNRGYRSWDLQSIFAWDLRSNVVWITIAHRSNGIRDHWINFILDHRSTTNSITWDHWRRWIIAIWDHRTIS